MGKQAEFPNMEIVDIRLKVPRYKREKLKLLAVLEKTTMNSLLEKCVDKMIAESEGLKALSQIKKE